MNPSTSAALGVIPILPPPAPMAERCEAQSCSLADDCSSITVS